MTKLAISDEMLTVKSKALRLARNYIKAELKERGEKTSDYDPMEITKAARELLKEHPEIIEEATRDQ